MDMIRITTQFDNEANNGTPSLFGGHLATCFHAYASACLLPASSPSFPIIGFFVELNLLLEALPV